MSSDEDEMIDMSARRHAPGTVKCPRCYHRVKALADGTPGKHTRKRAGSEVEEPCVPKEGVDDGGQV